MRSIIGLSGFIGAGKGTVADVLIKDYGFTKLSMADKLKDVVAIMFGWPRELLEGDTKESREFREQPDEYWSEALGREITPRWVLQRVGTECMRRGLHDNIWVNIAKKEILDNPTVNYVIPDIRFPNEVQMVRELYGEMWRVKRGPEPEWWDYAEAANSETFLHAPEAMQHLEHLGIHQSEWGWVGTKFDVEIKNDGTLEDLLDRVTGLVLSRLGSSLYPK